MNDITKIKRDVKDLEKGLLTKIDFNNRVVEIYEVYIGYFVEALSDTLITIYNIETDTYTNVIICEGCNIYQYKQHNNLVDYYKQIKFKEGNRN